MRSIYTILRPGRLLAAAALIAWPIGAALAVETDYAAGARFLPLQQAGGTARATAMGSAVVAVSQGAASLLWNPAGLSRMNCTEISLHHNTALGDTIQETAIFGMPLGGVKNDGKGGSPGGIAVSFGYVGYGSFEGRDAQALQTADYHAGDYSGSVGWGRELLPGFSGGIALKGNRSRLANKTYNAFAADAGFLWSVTRAVDLGVAYSNIKAGAGGNTGELAAGWRLGAAWTANKHLLLAVSSELQNGGGDRFQAGVEYLIGNTENKENILAIRGGYQLNDPDPQSGGLTGLTLGLGYTFSRPIVLDYAMVQAGELGASHKLSLTFKFGRPG